MATKHTWEGGYVLEDSKGRPTYYIRRQVNGRRYDISTRAHAHRAALKHLERFEADPEAYDPAGAPRTEALHLDDRLVADYLEWCRDERRSSPHWLNNKRHYLAWWIEVLAGVDLRRVSLTDHLKPALKGTAGRAHKIATLKHIYTWLRRERSAVTLAQDPTIENLPVPQAKPAQWTKSKVIPIEDYEQARRKLEGHWRDAMDIQAATGWHVTEVARFARAGAVEDYPGKDRSVAGVLVCPLTKGGEEHRTAVSKAALAAGKRLLEHGKLSIRKYHAAVIEACDSAGVEVFTPGRFRHSIATWAINKGAAPSAVSAFLNHKSSVTTRRFYATHAVPAKVPTLR